MRLSGILTVSIELMLKENNYPKFQFKGVYIHNMLGVIRRRFARGHMLSGINFKNFQGFRGHQAARLAPITLIFGPNASGKSSIRRILQTMQTAFSDTEKKCEDSTLPQTLGHLAFGADVTKKITGAPFGVGLSMTGHVSGESDPQMFSKPVQVEIGVDFEAEQGGIELQQIIEFTPDLLPNFHGFQFLKPIDQLSEFDLKTLEGALENMLQSESTPEDQTTSTSEATDSPGQSRGTISVSREVLDRRIARSRADKAAAESAWDEFKTTQSIVDSSGFLVIEDFHWSARYLLQLLKIGLKDLIPDSNHHQVFVYGRNESGDYELNIEYVASHFSEFLDREPGSERLEYEGADEELAELLKSRLHTTGFLFSSTSPGLKSFYPEDHWEDWEDDYGGRLPGKEAVAGALARSLESNSWNLRKILGENLRIIGPWRGIPEFEQPGDANALPSPAVQAKMNELLAALTDSRYQFEFKNTVGPRSSKNRSTVLDTFTNVSLPFDEVGTGLSQLLPILLDLAKETEGLTYIEEPELHLHPKAQSDLMDVIVDSFVHSVAEDGDARQFILETHSESMLLRLQKRIRNGDISGDDVAVLFMESVSPEDSDDGQGFNKVTELKIDHLGDVIDPFPVSFVDLRIRDLF